MKPEDRYSARKSAQDHFKDFAREYVEAAGSSLEKVGVERALSPQDLIDLTGYTCIQTEKDPCGYEVFEYEGEDGDRVLLILDIMLRRWVKVE